ncbi:oxidoreductase [Acetobacter aceti NRIC 0242]|uniref:3-hydroxybutyrate dehydrogenase n=1 Tax=Acetobacter aceti NBRC 14818 TaxID=887700 RepID=A0AB33IB19_ACEAC|nr:SDR family oxidoreductase [Acetobacter aceti]TCS35305.1 NAD(P)-dependent dehydrogenase (short-subunit alcohol dehydrogenase family) [Acetobacter aceti NBRC 14818]BCK75307.1 3-hydroxybutyrate dehydrogenase [Acetobacter aceti NBRC 14818]GAN57403.1 oxidoreductase/short-chain dehydrogenase/reductase SDR [Acetobacter aceti NBRC 14818]GBO81182.1 oxidoreductase [Acetobacter aceti NRIC 0242]
MTMDFSKKSVFITGASRGIGLGVAQAFARAGASLTLLADDDAIFDVAASLNAKAVKADIGNASAITEGLWDHGPIDVLVNNAGLERLTPLESQDAETVAMFERIIHTNVVGTYHVTRLVRPLMRAGGTIINTASIWGRVAEPLFGAYVASKHAIIGLTKTWAMELGAQGIRVNAVAPGWVRTEAAMRSLATMSERSGQSEEDSLNAIIAAQALPGLMAASDVADTYLFLASPHAASITGQTIQIDRGEYPL